MKNINKASLLLTIFLITSAVINSCGTSKTRKQTRDRSKETIQSSEKSSSGVEVNSEYFLKDENYVGNKKIQNFAAAKKILKKLNYFGIKEEIYCGCEFSNGKIPFSYFTKFFIIIRPVNFIILLVFPFFIFFGIIIVCSSCFHQLSSFSIKFL